MSGGEVCCHSDPCLLEREPVPQFQLPDGTISRLCPRKLVTPESEFLLELYPYHVAGRYPSPGGPLEQTNFYHLAMANVGALIEKHGKT